MKAKAKASKSVLKAIDSVTSDLLCLLNFGRSFRDYPDVDAITGYTLAASVGLMAKRVCDALENVPDFSKAENADKADRAIEEAGYTLQAMSEILNELQHESDNNWKAGMSQFVGYLVFSMTLTAARHIEHAQTLLGEQGALIGFSSPDFDAD